MSLHEEKGDHSFAAAGLPQQEPKMTAGRYFITRFSSLKPPMDKVPNPYVAIRQVSAQQWNFFMCAWCAWVIDSFDFFTVSLTVTPLAKQFNKQNSDITWGITLVLMFRSVGSVIFGVWGDRFGRKWPFIVNNILFIVIELGTGFCNTYKEFLACRALFGIAMGGLYGNAVATALEDIPDTARGIMSGLFQAGYPVGYLLATAFFRALVPTTEQSWRSLFWFSAGLPIFVIVWRYFLPETQTYREREFVRQSASTAANSFLYQASVALQHHWLTLAYVVVLLASFNYMAHGSQDFYPTILVNQFQFTSTQLTVTQVVANLGAASGAICVGYLSEIFGRRFTIMTSCLCAGALIYPYTYVTTPAVAACAFFLQFFVQGAFGVIPTHLMELSPAALRTFAVGTAYQLGNLASSPAATIQSSVGERYFPLSPGPGGVKRYDYAKVLCAFLGACTGLVFIITFLGPEKKGKQFGFSEAADDFENSTQELKKSVMTEHKESV